MIYNIFYIVRDIVDLKKTSNVLDDTINMINQKLDQISLAGPYIIIYIYKFSTAKSNTEEYVLMYKCVCV